MEGQQTQLMELLQRLEQQLILQNADGLAILTDFLGIKLMPAATDVVPELQSIPETNKPAAVERSSLKTKAPDPRKLMPASSSKSLPLRRSDSVPEAAPLAIVTIASQSYGIMKDMVNERFTAVKAKADGNAVDSTKASGTKQAPGKKVEAAAVKVGKPSVGGGPAKDTIAVKENADNHPQPSLEDEAMSFLPYDNDGEMSQNSLAKLLH